MLKNTLLLSRVALCNLFGLNEARFARDKKKKRRAIFIFATYIILAVMMMFYVALISVGLGQIGVIKIVPVMLSAVISLITLAFTFFWAGGALFSLTSYEREIALPVSAGDIVASRFLVMYVPNAAMAILAMLSGFAVYAYYAAPSAPAYIMAFLGALVTPLIPMSIACILGALVYGAASVMRHKNFVNIILALAATMAFMVLPYILPDEADANALLDLSRAFEGIMSRVYVPSVWFSAGVVSLDWAGFALFAGVSALAFAAMELLVKWKFADICRGLAAKHTNGRFKLSQQKRAGALPALYKKELGRYFASPIYVLNTIIGYVMMLAGSIAVAVMGAGELEGIIPGGILTRFLPFALAALSSMSTTTSSSISMEGRQWWITQTLPVKPAVIFDAKALVQLTVSLPFFLVSCAILAPALGMGAADAACMCLTPLCYILFTAQLGITINLAWPVFNWDSETTVVKQSAAMGLSMLAGLVSVAIPAVVALVFAQCDPRAVCLISGAAVLTAAFILRSINARRDLRDIGE